MILALVAAVVYAAGGDPPPAASTMSVSTARFVNSLRHADATAFVATYRLTNYLYFQDGTLVVAQIPSPPGTTSTPNVDGYAGTGRRAFVYRGPDHLLAQWIEIGTNVSACQRPPDPSGSGPLTCSKPNPYIPSNAFAMQDAGFVPTYVASSLAQFAAATSRAHPTVSTLSTRVSRAFGPLTCLRQRQTPTVQTTCLDGAGYLVSWAEYNGASFTAGASLLSLGRRPSARAFSTLGAPTKSFLLPFE